MHLQHVGIVVDDAEKARRFYVEVMGLHELPRPDLGIPGSWLGGASGGQLHVIELSDARPLPPGVHVAFEVADLDAEIARLAELGHEVGPVNTMTGARQAFLTDPSGNTIELNQPVPVGETDR